KGKAWATEKVEAGKAWAVGKAKGIKDRITGKGGDEATAAEGEQDGADTRTPAEKQQALDTAIGEATAVAHRAGTTREDVDTELPAIAERHGLRQLRTVDSGPEAYHIHGEVNPKADSEELP